MGSLVGRAGYYSVRSVPYAGGTWTFAEPLRSSAMMTLLLLLALVLLLVYADWLWTASRVPGVRAAGLVELLMSLAAGVLVGCLLAEGCGGVGDAGG